MVAISLDEVDAEARYRLEPVDRMTAERIYERRWALTLLEGVLKRLRGECVEEGKAELFEGLKGCLTAGEEAVPHAEVAGRLGMSEGAVRTAAHRLRGRYREILREEIAETVAGPGEVEEEIRYLLEVLAAGRADSQKNL